MALDLPIPMHARPFVEAFFSEAAPRAQVIIAPVQTGAGSTILAIVSRALEEGERALIVVPFVLAGDQSIHRLRDAGWPGPITFVHGATFREQVAVSDHELFRSPGIYVATVALVSGPALEAVLAADWKIVAIDSCAGVGRSHSAMISSLVDSPRVARLLVRTDFPARLSSSTDGALARLPVTEWKLETLRDAEGKPLFRPHETQTIDYERGADEVGLLRALHAFARKTPRESTLMRYALSSPAALEFALRRTLNREGNPAADGPEELESTSEPLVGTTPTRHAGLLDRLDELANDAKLEALAEALPGVLSEERRVVVITSYLETARYVYSALAGRGYRAFCLSSDLTAPERTSSLRAFFDDGGILVATTAVLQGIDLRGVGVVVHYEPPLSAMEHYARVSRLMSREGTKAVREIVLRDSSDAAAYEPDSERGMHWAG